MVEADECTCSSGTQLDKSGEYTKRCICKLPVLGNSRQYRHKQYSRYACLALSRELALNFSRCVNFGHTLYHHNHNRGDIKMQFSELCCNYSLHFNF